MSVEHRRRRPRPRETLVAAGAALAAAATAFYLVRTLLARDPLAPRPRPSRSDGGDGGDPRSLPPPGSTSEGP